MDMKLCKKCDRTLSVAEFSAHPTRGLQTNCKECQKVISKDWYARNKAHHLENVAARKEEALDRFNLWKEGLHCVQCKEHDSVCLDFHHVDPKQKDFVISEVVRDMSVAKLKTELRKCVVVCRNCHAKVHAGHIRLAQPIQLCNVDEL